MTEPPLTEKIVRVTRAFDVAAIPHAVGGAIALGYHAEPRGTLDIDLDVFLPETEAARVLDCLVPLGVDFDRSTALEAVLRDGQARVHWGSTPIDLFFAYHALHDACRAHSRIVPFAETTIRILSAEDLAVWKVLFDRSKDWLDLEQVLLAQGDRFDHTYVLRWIEEVLGREDPRCLRFRELTSGPRA